jgi:pimeloyl-ACP methyl ester carboxylesterase
MTEYVLERQGAPVHYWIEGPEDRPLIICTHGATVDHQMFAAQLPALTPTYRVLTWDVRGHGRSRPLRTRFSINDCLDDLLAIMDAVGVNQATFLGHSMGGNISQDVAFRLPQRVTALIIIDSTCNTARLTSSQRWQVRLTPLILALYPYRLLLRQAARASSLKTEIQSYIYETSSLLTKKEYGQILTATTQCLHEQPDYQVPVPLLLLLGDHDTLGNIKSAMPAWAKRELHSQFVVVPQAGHCSLQDNPTFVNEQILHFLREYVPADEVK